MDNVSIGEKMVDIVEPEQEVQVLLSDGPDGLTLWVNVDGVCRLRVSQFAESLLKLDDKRLSQDRSY